MSKRKKHGVKRTDLRLFEAAMFKVDELENNDSGNFIDNIAEWW